DIRTEDKFQIMYEVFIDENKKIIETGGMMANYFFIFTDVGINFALFAFVAVALGGFGSIIGCLYAGIIIGLVESLGGLLIDPSFKLLYVFVIYLIVVIYRPQGLFGRY
ncbi:hypothetical protein OAR81_01065, partial [Candidatus Pelagibacter sp.]|nr:hypothetical protein [Candidatus Pelagibacter sp.]